MLSRRRLLGGLLAAGTAGCASSGPNSTLNLFSRTITSHSPAADEYPLSAERIQEIPYATLGVRVDDQTRAVMVLANLDGRVLQWVSADRVIFETEGGRLLRTRGLKRDLVDTRWRTEAPDPFVAFSGDEALPGRGVYREVDIGEERAVAVESRFQVRGTETITILGQQHTVRRVDEHAIDRSWRWETRNSFWIDPQTGRVWRSFQQYCPEIPPIELELLKPAAV